MSEQSFKREQVMEILGSVLRCISSAHAMDATLVQDVTQLKASVDSLRAELAEVHPDHIHSHIPNATDELDAIVTTTENATNTIMGACESIQQLLAGKPAAETEAIESEIIRIVEACTFQDLTGQRIPCAERNRPENDGTLSLIARQPQFQRRENRGEAER